MIEPEGPAGATRGSILLPVIVVLLLIASAATAMTLQARTSLREAAIRRDRLALGFMADGVARSAAQVLGMAIADHRLPPFALNGMPQACAMPGGGGIVLTVQDDGGLVDLNKASRELLLLVLQRGGLSGWDATATMDAILRRREGGGPVASARPTQRHRSNEQSPRAFASVDEIDRLPGITSAVFDRLAPAFTVGSGSTMLDPTLAGPGIRALIEPRELTGPTMAPLTAPSSHNAYTMTGLAISAKGMRAARRAELQLDPGTAAVKFTAWNALLSIEAEPTPSAAGFCRVMANLLGVL